MSGARIEDYALIGDLQTAALVERGGSIDWLCFPRFDSGACFAALLGTEENGRWVIAPVNGGTTQRRYLHDTFVLETTWESDEGSVRVLDFMPPRGKAPDVVRIIEGLRGSVRMRSELVIRFDYGHIVPWVRRADGARLAIAGPDGLCFRTPASTHGENMRTISEFVVEEGERVPFVLTWFPSHEDDAGGDRPRGGALRDRDLLAGVDRRRRRRASSRAARRRLPLAHAPEGPYVWADRRHRRCTDDVAAGVDRKRAQLGLPLLLAPRRNADVARVAQLRLRRRSAAVAPLAPARDRRRSGGRPDHVRRRRRTAAGGVRAALARGVRGLGACAGRQRRERSVADRRLRRADGCAVPGARPRASDREACLGAPACPPRLSREDLEPARTAASGRFAANRATSCTRR